MDFPLIFIYSCTIFASLLHKPVLSKKNKSDKEYIAAVVEYNSINNGFLNKAMMENTIIYEKIIHNARNYNVDIIVFPEVGLTGIEVPEERSKIKEYMIEIPEPEKHVIPFLDEKYNNEVLKRLSYTAKENHMYVVVNLMEIEQCSSNDTECPDDGGYFYNTNVVFNRIGAVIARYRKINLFCEPAFNYPKSSDLCTFDTDFGVTFGMFICFDILFSLPSVQLVRDKEVTDIIFSTAWLSEYPLLISNEIQSAWSYAMDVNMLSSNLNFPNRSYGGSGIYGGNKGPLVVYLSGKEETRLLIATVQKKKMGRLTNLSQEQKGPKELENTTYIIPAGENNFQNKTYSNMIYLTDPAFRNASTQILKNVSKEETRSNFSYLGKGFSCKLEVTYKADYHSDIDDDNNSTTHYKLFGYSGKRSFICTENHIEMCGLSLCSNIDEEMCIYPNGLSNNVTILSVKIWANSLNISSDSIPVTLDQNMRPLESTDFRFSGRIICIEGTDIYSSKMELLKPIPNLSTFAIYKMPYETSAHDSKIV